MRGCVTGPPVGAVIAVSALLAGLALAGLAMAGDPFGFVPEGGRTLFARAFPDRAGQRAALAVHRSAEAWRAALDGSGLDDVQAATLAAYLAEVAPLQPGEMDMPADGRDLALMQCQSCHSLFAGYLMQRRDRQGWLAIFASPFHGGIPMDDRERAIFADYSAINLPLRLQDVPPEFRF